MATPIVTGDRASASVLFTQSAPEHRRRLQLVVGAAAQIESLCGAVLQSPLDDALIQACVVRIQDLAEAIQSSALDEVESVTALGERIEGRRPEVRHD